MKRYLSVLLVFALILVSVPVQNVQAAGTSASSETGVTAISLPKPTVGVIRGLTHTLNASITGSLGSEESLTWTSSNTDIAVVNSAGVVTGVKNGKTKITVAAPNGVKTTCTVYVVDKPTRMTMDKTTLIMTAGTYSRLYATITPTTAKRADVKWATSNKKSVVVSRYGTLKAVKDGTAIITAKTANGLKATCKVIVATPTKVTLNKSKLSLTPNQSYSLTATIAPTSAKNATLTWSSSNKKVATVTSNGKVKAIKSGTATITVKSANGKKATCKVTVAVPKSIKLSRGSVTGLPGQSFSLTATVLPAAASGTTINWKSSNTKVATVSASGRVKFVGTGTAVITATTANGKKATCKVTAKAYGFSNGKLKVGSANGVKTYTLYKQLGYGSYYQNCGCVTTAVAIAASAFGKSYTPQQIHEGSAAAVYSERYAVSKMGASASLYGYTAISVRLASQILTDMGIKNTPVYSYTDASAIAQIQAHLAKGKPVIVKANNTKYDGVQIANGHHAMVLVGIDEKGNGIFIEPFNGTLNYAHGNGTYFTRTVTSFIANHMTSATGNVYVPYVTSLAAAGGYILVG